MAANPEKKASCEDALVVSLKDHITDLLREREARVNVKFEALDRALLLAAESVKTAMAASEKALVKAELATERRFEGVNEFRAAMADQQATFARKTEVDILINAINNKVDLLMAQQHKHLGKESGVGVVWGVVVVVMGFMLTGGIIISTLLLRH